MEFRSARDIENVIWSLKLADVPRGENRARIDNLFNGAPPYTPNELEENRFQTNVNDLSASRIFHDSTKQFSNAMLKPGNFFTVTLDSGPTHKRTEWGQIITREINKRMKRSQPYRQTLRNVFAQLVLHGIGPVTWANKEKWCPTMHQMCDVLVPSQTLLTMENLSYFAIYRRYTAAELERVTRGPKRDKGWKMATVNAAMKWAAKQEGTTISGADMNWTPERIAEEIKSNSCFWSSDQVPTINCWDVYFISDDRKNSGWRRRIILDTPSRVDDERMTKITADTKNIIGGRDQFLYDSGNRNYANALEEIIHFQFADGSVVAPYRYHSVRSLGFLLYALCHLHNRLRCRVTDSTFENLLNYIRVANPDDAERLKKIDLINLGFLPDGWNFVTQQERWQVNQNLIQMLLNMNRQSMAESSPSFNQDFGQGTDSAVEKTATQITAEINKASSTVGTILQEAYEYQTFQYIEICRRFSIRNSNDGDVRKFRNLCLKAGVPEEYLDSERWNVTPDRVMGNGNKQLEIAQSQMVMEKYQLLDPDAQRIALRDYFFAVTDDPAKVNLLVPLEKNLVTDSVHDAELSAATLLLGISMGLKQGVNHGEYSATLLGAMSTELKKIEARGGVATPDDVAGLQNIAGQTIEGQPIPGNGVTAHIDILSQDKESRSEVKQLQDVLGRLMNELKGAAQRMEEQQGEQNGNGQLPPEEAVRLKAMLVQSETKAEIAKQNAAQKLQHRQESHQQKLEQTQARDELSNANEIRRTQVQESALDLATAAKIQRESSAPSPDNSP